MDQPLKQRRTQQCSLAEDVNKVVFLRSSDERKPAAQITRDELEFLSHHAAPVQKRVQFFVFERLVSDLYTAIAQQRLPLFEAITLAWRRIIERRHQGENTHRIRLVQYTGL